MRPRLLSRPRTASRPPPGLPLSPSLSSRDLNGRGSAFTKKSPIESVVATCACNYSLREKPTKRLRALAHLMGVRVRRRALRVFIVRAHISRARARARARIRAASRRPLDLPCLSGGTVRRHKVGPGRFGTLPRGAFVTSHVARMFPFFSSCRSFPSRAAGGFSPVRVSSSSFSFSPIRAERHKRGTRDLLRSGNPSADYNLPLNPFRRRYVCAPREGLCGLSAATDVQFLHFRRSPFARPLCLGSDRRDRDV